MTVCPFLSVVVTTVAPLCVLVPPPPITYPDVGQIPGSLLQFVMVCVEKTVVVPVPGRGLQVPVPTLVGPEVELQEAPEITVGVRAQV